jgi:hypothetical protein
LTKPHPKLMAVALLGGRESGGGPSTARMGKSVGSQRLCRTLLRFSRIRCSWHRRSPGIGTTKCGPRVGRADDYVTKPFGIRELMARITDWPAGSSLDDVSAAHDGRIAFIKVVGQSAVYVAELEAGGKHIHGDPRRLTLEEGWNQPSAWTADNEAVISGIQPRQPLRNLSASSGPGHRGGHCNRIGECLVARGQPG